MVAVVRTAGLAEGAGGEASASGEDPNGTMAEGCAVFVVLDLKKIVKCY